MLLFGSISSCGEDDACDNCGGTDTRMSDSLTLVALYDQTDGPNWDQIWDLNMPMDSWFGITLNPSGTVKFIELQGNGHKGSIPNSLSQLTEPVAIELRSGELSGGIPEGFGSLSTLRFLRFDDNGLDGAIPNDLINLTNLEVLDLAENNLTGSIPTGFGKFTRFDFLDLSNNQLSGEIPADLGDVPGFVFLTLRFNNFSGCIPQALRSQCSILGMDLSFNPLLPYEGDTEKFCGGFPNIGAPCKVDGEAGLIDEDCNCVK